MVVGILKIFAALARPTTLFFIAWRSIDWTPNAICGWWSMMISWLFCGVRTSSFGLDMMSFLGTGLRAGAGLAWLQGGAPGGARRFGRGGAAAGGGGGGGRGGGGV